MQLVVGEPVPARLAEARVLDAAGQPHVLGASWADRDAVILFVRHFGCAGCSAHVGELRPRLEELAELGTRVVLVGNGSVAQLAAWVAEQRLANHPLELYTDPALEAFHAAGLVRSWLGAVGPRALWNVARLTTAGHRTERPRGHFTQQGGTLYVRRGGTLALHHRSQRIGDYAALVDVVAIALAARAAEATAMGIA